MLEDTRTRSSKPPRDPPFSRCLLDRARSGGVALAREPSTPSRSRVSGVELTVQVSKALRCLRLFGFLRFTFKGICWKVHGK